MNNHIASSYIVVFLFLFTNSLLGQQRCSSLDSAIIIFSHTFNKSVSISNTDYDLNQINCYNIILSDEKQSLLNIIAASPFSIKSAGSGYSLIIDPNKNIFFGKILNQSTGAPVSYAVVYNTESNAGTYADGDGRFLLKLNNTDKQIFRFSCVGYKVKEVNYNTALTRQKTIFLEEDNVLPELLVDEFQVTPDNFQTTSRDLAHRIPKHKLYHEASVMGQADVLRYLTTFPEVNASADGISAFRVRGGSHDQNLVLMNDVPLYHQSHGIGLHSVFNSSIIDQATLYTGFFPARFQGKTSSVIDIQTKNGSMDKYHGTVDLSPFGFNMSANGPIIKNKLSIAASGRYSNVSSIREKINFSSTSVPADEQNSSVKYYDFNLNLFAQLSENTSVVFNGFMGQDRNHEKKYFEPFDIIGDIIFEENYKWNNKNASIKFRTNIFSKHHLTIQPYISSFSYNSNSNDYYSESEYTSIFNTKFKSEISEYGLKTNLGIVGQKTIIDNIGIHFVANQFTPGIYSFDTREDSSLVAYEQLKQFSTAELFEQDTISSSEFVLYADKTINLGKNTQVDLGISTLLYFSDNHTFLTLQPRIAFQHRPKENLLIQSSFGIMSQQKHLLSASNNGLANDLWMPANQAFKPQQSIQVDANIHWKVSDKIKLTWNNYFKRQTNIVKLPDEVFSIDESQTNIDIAFWQESATTGQRKSYGSSIQAQYLSQKLELKSAYTLSKSSERYETFIDNAWAPNFYHRDHQFNLSMIWRPIKNLSLTPAFIYGSPTTLTFDAGIYNIYSSEEPEYFDVFEEFQSHTYGTPAFKRLDFTINYVIPGNRFIHRVKASIFNVLNKKNYSHYIHTDSGFFDEYIGLSEYNLFIQHGPSRIYSLNYALSF